MSPSAQWLTADIVSTGWAGRAVATAALCWHFLGGLPAPLIYAWWEASAGALAVTRKLGKPGYVGCAHARGCRALARVGVPISNDSATLCGTNRMRKGAGKRERVRQLGLG